MSISLIPAAIISSPTQPWTKEYMCIQHIHTHISNTHTHIHKNIHTCISNTHTHLHKPTHIYNNTHTHTNTTTHTHIGIYTHIQIQSYCVISNIYYHHQYNVFTNKDKTRKIIFINANTALFLKIQT